MTKHTYKLKLLLIIILLFLPCTLVKASRADCKVDESYPFNTLQTIAVLTPEIQVDFDDGAPSLKEKLREDIIKELRKHSIYLTEESSVATQATLHIALKKLEVGELIDPAHVNWHRQNNSVQIPTADGKNSTSIDLGVSIPEFVPARKYNTSSATLCFTLTENATGKTIFQREQERTDMHTEDPGRPLSKLIKDFHKHLQKLIHQR